MGGMVDASGEKAPPERASFERGELARRRPLTIAAFAHRARTIEMKEQSQSCN